jgi:hypothetical protein
MRKLALFSFCATLVVAASAVTAKADTILANWTFETSIPTTAGPFAAEAGVNAGSSAALGNTGGTYSSPAGNGVGSLHSFSSTAWDVGDYWQFSVPTTGYSSLSLAFDQAGSNTGPGNFTISTSLDGTTFTPLPSSAYTVTLSNWNTTTLQPGFTHTFSIPDGTVSVRLLDANTTSVNGATVASTGTDRIDNVIISGTAVPEPTTIVLGSLGLLGLFSVARQRKTG